jgi:hypothetical protein
MKPRLLLAFPLLLGAAPAFATGGFDCWTADRGIVLTASFGNSEGTPIDAVILQIDGQTFSSAGDWPRLTILRRHFDVTPGRDAREIHVALAWRPSARTEFELRGRLERGGTGHGTFVRNGVSYPVRCEMERMDE